MKKRFSIGSKYEYCPNGNHWQDISGMLDNEIFLFCDCNKCNGQVYVLRARKFKLDAARQKEFVEELRQRNKLDDTRQKINFRNMDKINELLANGEK